MIRRRRGGVGLAASTVLLAGCASASMPPLSQPRTAVAAAGTARTLLADYASHRFADAWQILIPARQADIPRGTWTRFYNACPAVATWYSIDQASMASPDSALVTVTVAVKGPDGQPGTPYPLRLTFDYLSGGWRYAPDQLPITPGDTAEKALKDARAAGVC